MSDLAAIIAAASGTLGLLGGGIAFVWNKIESRRLAEKAENDERFAAIEKKLDDCVTRERRSLERRGAQLTVIELLWAELSRVAPTSAVLGRARTMLSDLKLKVLADQVDDASADDDRRKGL